MSEPKYGNFSGPYFPTLGLNTEYLSVFSPNAEKKDQKKFCIWTLFTQCLFNHSFTSSNLKYVNILENNILVF